MPDIQSLLAESSRQLQASSDSAQLDVEILLCHTLNKDRSHLRAWPEKKLTDEQLKQFKQLFDQRLQGLPIAYLTGKREFWSRDFITTPAVLIPRPETETLIELCFDLIPKTPNMSLLDLGTGSGIIAITLAAEFKSAQVIAVDKSSEALAVAQQNATLNNTKNIEFIQSDWFAQVPQQQFNFILSNPPYINPADPHLQQGDVRFEPSTALVAENHGLQDIMSIAKQSKDFLKPNGYLILEHGYDQQQPVHEILTAQHYSNIHCLPDLAGQARVSYAQWQPTS
ncbi:MAG: peptide chain release factor N(5)-glutamine methyltransferase [Methyloprofundus sp.]|nr:peptide chain release factor N(5)-glutamine methyltransferase [Methyloprofundus sp.]